MMLRSALFAAAAFLVVAALYFYSQLMVPFAPIKDMLEVEIAQGDSLAAAIEKLDERGLVKDRRLFKAVARLTGVDRRLAPGYYQFYGTLAPWDIYKMLRDRRMIKWQVTVVEGDNLGVIRAKLVALKITRPDEFDSLASDPRFLERMGINAPSLEGYLFPDTYDISKGAKAEEVLEMMVRRLEEVYGEEFKRRAEFLGFTMREVLTLASIVEKEARLDSERPIISGVYHNRLKKGMPLQADPTAVYGIKPQSAGIKLSDLKRKTDYNTYQITGLPPGPIASPGLKSIRAALYPSNVPYLFFVANMEGGHTFSTTGEEHERAVQEYREKKLAAQIAAQLAAAQEAATSSENSDNKEKPQE